MPELTAQIQQALAETIPADARWQPLAGGRTNRVWRVRWAGQDMVVKLYRGADRNPLFPNDPVAEFACLRAVALLGLAPEPLEFLDTGLGRIVTYRFVGGQVGQADSTVVGQTLRRLHGVTPPPGLRTVRSGAGAVLDQARRIIAVLEPDLTRDLIALQPALVAEEPTVPVFLHGDVVPANILHTANGVMLIDWQCPATGDPVEDIACYLSPAMQVAYGGGPLSDVDKQAVLDGYGDATVTSRYQRMAGMFHYRMAAYCLWRVAQGDADYEAAYAAEVAALGQFRNRDQRRADDNSQ